MLYQIAMRTYNADDTVLVANSMDIFDARQMPQNDLYQVADWCKGNKLSINVKKKKKYDYWH